MLHPEVHHLNPTYFLVSSSIDSLTNMTCKDKVPGVFPGYWICVCLCIPHPFSLIPSCQCPSQRDINGVMFASFQSSGIISQSVPISRLKLANKSYRTASGEFIRSDSSV